MKDPAREACRERCAEVGDPPCYRFDDDAKIPFTPCSECLESIGVKSPIALDPDAAIRNLI